MKLIRLLTALAALALATPSVAQPYVFGSFSSDTASTDVQSGMSGSGSQAGLGYRFTGNLAAELSYLDSDGRSDVAIRTRFWDASGYGLSVIGSVQVARSFSILGKLGIYRLDADLRELTGSTDITTTETVSASSVGVGVSYALSEQVHLRAIAEQLRSDDGLRRLRIVSAGIAYYF